MGDIPQSRGGQSKNEPWFKIDTWIQIKFAKDDCSGIEILYWHLYTEPQNALITPFLTSKAGYTNQYKEFLLSILSPQITHKVARFCMVAVKSR